jgi:hypothetical protein
LADPVIRFVFENIKANYGHVVRAVAISAIILGYAMLAHYPRMHMYYTTVAPALEGEADVLVQLSHAESFLKRAELAAEEFNESLESVSLGRLA